MEDIMQDIVKEIVRIDSTVFTTKQDNEEMLIRRKEQYENQMKSYREEVIGKAEQEAIEIYNQIVESGTQQYKKEEEKSKEIIRIIENHYLQAEKTLLDQIFNELFILEE